MDAKPRKDSPLELESKRKRWRQAKDRARIRAAAGAATDYEPAPDSARPSEAELAGIEARKAAIRAGWHAPMGDGRAEIDQPARGVAPRSGKDHAAEGRKVFTTSPISGHDREVRVHKAHMDHSRIGKDWHS